MGRFPRAARLEVALASPQPSLFESKASFRWDHTTLAPINFFVP
jgi:hypothetical protein